ncbi:MAG: methyltransferase, partial [Dehalococcoidia bacterium]
LDCDSSYCLYCYPVGPVLLNSKSFTVRALLIVMIAWINFAVLIISALLFLYFYVKSVSPAALEKKIGEVAYIKCKRYRLIASGFELIALTDYVVYFFYPLPVSLPPTFHWNYWISVAIACAIGIPGTFLMLWGLKDAGAESLTPDKHNALFGGIYNKIRHPQATGEVTLWWVAAFLLNSPFLALFSFIWLPVFYMLCWAEERDLVIRYGDAYLEYRKNTGFIIPKSGRSAR